MKTIRFGIISDPHIALPQTITENPYRFHMSEVSIPAFEVALAELEAMELDFLLLPGDLTQHGEPENHAWLVERLGRSPCPVFVVPGNHDIPQAAAGERAIAATEFPQRYQKFGYGENDRPYYHTEILPDLHLIGLNSNQFDAEGNQIPVGQIDAVQLDWLQETLTQLQENNLQEDESTNEFQNDSELETDRRSPTIWVMLHHNLLEHFPGQAEHSMGRRYMVENASEVLPLLERAKVSLIFTGHLHVQDITQQQGFSEITTGSLVSYPHPYRVLHYREDQQGRSSLQVESRRVRSLPQFADLSVKSREWMGDRSFSFMYRFLTEPPLSLSAMEAEAIAPELRYFWADIAEGDAQFDFAQLPEAVRRYLHRFSALNAAGEYNPIDNQTVLRF